MKGLETKHLGVVDYILFSLLLVVSLGIGIYSALKGRGNNSTEEYLLGGRQMAPLPVAISLLGGVISAVSIMGLSAEMYYFGTQLSLSLVGCIFGIILVQQIILPVLYPLQMVSMHQYVEMRFGSSRLRKVSSFCILMVGFFSMGLYLYAPSLTLSTVTNLSTMTSIVIIGSICTFYITIGGVKAVVYTDVVQTILMFIGVLAVVAVGCIDLGGVGEVIHIANEGGRIEFFNLNPDPLVRHTLWSVLVMGIYGMLAWVGLNQPTFQRFSSVKSLTISKRLATFFLVGISALWLTFYSSGIVAYATYSNCDPLTSGRIEKPDQILPYMVLDKLSNLTGMPGLFVASIYGGVLSSVSSSGNSVACLLWEDILKDLDYFRGFDDTKATRVVKLLSVVSGIIGILLGILAGQLGNIFLVAVSITNAFSAPCCSLFLSGICTPWVNAKGGYAAVFTSLGFNLWILLGKFIKGFGYPKSLPLSVEGCPENLLPDMNATLSPFENNATFSDYYLYESDDFLTTTLMPDDSILKEEEVESSSIYSLSYCYIGMFGVILGIIVSTVVSLLTGPLSPDEVEPRLVNQLCHRIHRVLWVKFKGKSHRRKPDDNSHPYDKEATVPMMTIDLPKRKENGL